MLSFFYSGRGIDCSPHLKDHSLVSLKELRDDSLSNKYPSEGACRTILFILHTLGMTHAFARALRSVFFPLRAALVPGRI